MSKKTTIALDKDTKDRLATFGSKGDRYEDIITHLMDKVGDCDCPKK